MDDFVHPFNAHEPAFQLNDVMQAVKVCDCIGVHDGNTRGAQDVCMFRNFARQVASGELNEEWPRWTWLTQLVQDACLESALHGGKSAKVINI
jgi:hypothetical protein